MNILWDNTTTKDLRADLRALREMREVPTHPLHNKFFRHRDNLETRPVRHNTPLYRMLLIQGLKDIMGLHLQGTTDHRLLGILNM
jgi:hypothetical protein